MFLHSSFYKLNVTGSQVTVYSTTKCLTFKSPMFRTVTVPCWSLPMRRLHMEFNLHYLNMLLKDLKMSLDSWTHNFCPSPISVFWKCMNQWYPHKCKDWTQMHIFLLAFNLWCCYVVFQLLLLQIWENIDCSKNVFSVPHYVLMGKDIRQPILRLTLMVHPWDQTRDMKPRPKLAGIWMVSSAREDGLKGKVTGKMCLASMSNWGESFLSRRRIWKDKKVITWAFSHFIDNNNLVKGSISSVLTDTPLFRHTLYANLTRHVCNNCAIKL